MTGGGEVASRMAAPLPDVKESTVEQVEEPAIELDDEAPAIELDDEAPTE